eukprot:scaffold897_cov402-Prasinococcus_capsulatus_cf.AAC.23
MDVDQVVALKFRGMEAIALIFTIANDNIYGLPKLFKSQLLSERLPDFHYHVETAECLRKVLTLLVRLALAAS